VNAFDKSIGIDLKFMSYAQTVYISALTGQRVDKLLSMLLAARENGMRRITTGLLNECISEAVTATEPPSDKGRRLKVFYATQVAVSPPHFIIFVNDAKLMHFSYLRYLENYLRKSFDFSGTPIKLSARNKDGS
jgi:GTP-binding protein